VKAPQTAGDERARGSRRILVVDPAPPSRDFILDAIRRRGYWVTGLSPLAESPSLERCDDRLVAPLVPFEECAAAVDAAQGREPFCGVVAYHQAAVAVANRLAARLSLPGIWDDPDLDAGDKAIVYRLWEEAGVPFPPARVARARDDPVLDELRYPVVVKPSGMQGGIGARRCFTRAEASEWVDRLTRLAVPFELAGRVVDMVDLYDPPRSIIVQEYVVADAIGDARPEFTLELVVRDGEIGVIGCFEKSHANAPYFDDVSYLFPAPSLPEGSPPEILALGRRALEAVGFRNGFCHLEWTYVDGRPTFFELNPRIIGAHAPALMGDACGVDFSGMIADIASGSLDRLPAFEPSRCVGIVYISMGKDQGGHVFAGIDETDAPDVQYELTYQREPNKVVEQPDFWGGERVAEVTLRTDDPERLVEAARYWTSRERLLVAAPPPV
jgi:hypothetical protein